MTTNEFFARADANEFGDAQVELIRGEVVFAGRISNLHARTKMRVARIFGSDRDRPHALASPTIEIQPHSAPQPDVTVFKAGLVPLRERARFVQPHEVEMAIELTTKSYDPRMKASLYAENGILLMLVLDPERLWAELWCAPENGRYTAIEEFEARDVLPVETGGQERHTVASLLG